ncbi:hypothetical protein [Mesonia maritima]|uniref:Anti-sigma factor n=1 Tax=Mesonia maritima TaxID=1793873 RepID=A0ABU1K5D0_9FLAO|nr:hypothetical protein [Mesonia maritima]MDR6300501.1 hypothetical protein [Mesonia maritima]
MAQDLRKLFEKEKEKKIGKPLQKGHQARFLERLDNNLPAEKKEKKPSFFFLKIAAILIVALGTTFFMYNQLGNFAETDKVVNSEEQNSEKTETQPVYLSDVSPEFKKIEDYYLANINAELSQLNITEENKELIDSFMLQLSNLDKEYQRLNAELDDTGINEETVSALINNLELRLELLYKLKNKLTEIKKSSVEEMKENKI